MSRRGAVLRGVSKHQSYTIAEIALALRKCRGTVARWIKAGLPVMAEKKPHLIHGADIIAFHAARKATRQKCRLSECYCFRCRKPREPAGRMADLYVGPGSTGNLHALCCVCMRPMNKRVSLTKLDELRADLDVAIRQAPARIGE
jgi:hypothetical protein